MKGCYHVAQENAHHSVKTYKQAPVIQLRSPEVVVVLNLRIVVVHAVTSGAVSRKQYGNGETDCHRQKNKHRNRSNDGM